MMNLAESKRRRAAQKYSYFVKYDAAPASVPSDEWTPVLSLSELAYVKAEVDPED